MKKTKTFILYKIYYGEELVYLGRTTQLLQDRIRNHLFKRPMLKKIDINKVSKIEYAEFKTRADLYLYEIYYINLYKPIFNKDDKALTNCLSSSTINMFIVSLYFFNIEKDFKNFLKI